MLPQVGISGGTPRPRKLSAASEIIAEAMEKVPITSAEGSRWPHVERTVMVSRVVWYVPVRRQPNNDRRQHDNAAADELRRQLRTKRPPPPPVSGGAAPAGSFGGEGCAIFETVFSARSG